MVSKIKVRLRTSSGPKSRVPSGMLGFCIVVDGLPIPALVKKGFLQKIAPYLSAFLNGAQNYKDFAKLNN